MIKCARLFAPGSQQTSRKIAIANASARSKRSNGSIRGETEMKKFAASIALAMVFMMLQVTGRVGSYDVARLFSPHDQLGPGFFILFYIVYYAIPIYCLLLLASRLKKRHAPSD